MSDEQKCPYCGAELARHKIADVYYEQGYRRYECGTNNYRSHTTTFTNEFKRSNKCLRRQNALKDKMIEAAIYALAVIYEVVPPRAPDDYYGRSIDEQRITAWREWLGQKAREQD